MTRTHLIAIAFSAVYLVELVRSRRVRRWTWRAVKATGRAFWWLIVYLWRQVRGHKRFTADKRDPIRKFTAAQSRVISNRAGGQCEHADLLPDGTWWRCQVHRRAVGIDGSRVILCNDHIVPWSIGGPTILENGQLLCERHNLLKKDRVPTRRELDELRERRRGYWPTRRIPDPAVFLR